ncbi:MAG TPA: hypothetical protein VFE79_23555, partial [Paraburkholderia sp.]|nr:hypothetical protein [Paraburkholderia sp.]
MFDDELFVRAADSLRHTHWFGPYDKFTLAKGSFYPFFIAVTNVMHIPLYIGEQILYVLVCLLTSRYLARTSRRPALGVFCFALLALNPIFWNTEVTRAMRENIYISLSLGLVALTVALCWPAASGGRSRATQFVLGL